MGHHERDPYQSRIEALGGYGWSIWNIPFALDNCKSCDSKKYRCRDASGCDASGCDASGCDASGWRGRMFYLHNIYNRMSPVAVVDGHMDRDMDP